MRVPSAGTGSSPPRVEPPAVPRTRRRCSPAPSLLAPSILAACGGDDDDDGGERRAAAAVAATSHRDLELDGLHDRPVARRTSEPQTGHHRQLRRGHQRQQRVLHQDPARTCRKGKGTGRDGIVLTDWMASRLINQVDPPWVQPFDDGEVPEQGEPASPRCRHPTFDPTREYSAPWATGMTGIAYNIQTTGKEIRTIDDFLAVAGHEDGAHRDARHRRAVHAGRRRRPDEADVRRAPSRRSTRSRRRSTTARSTASTATTTSATSAPATSRPRSRGRATSRRSRSTTPTSASRSRSRAACSGPTTS